MSRMKTRNDDIERKIESHISSVVDMVKVIGDLSIGDLKNAENEEINKTDSFKENIVKEEVNKLEEISDMISKCLGAQPDILFFKPYSRVTTWRNLKNCQLDLITKLLSFIPKKINKLIQKELSDIVKTTENRAKIYKRTDKEN